MPESPKFLIANRKFEEARLVFKWIGMKNGLSIDEIEEKLEAIKFEGEEDPVDLIISKNKKKTTDVVNTDSETESESGKKLLVSKSNSSSSR